MCPEDYIFSLDLTPYPHPAPLDEAGCAAACDELLRYLMRERGLIAAFSSSYEVRRRLLRDAVTRRQALPVPADILALQDGLLWTETLARGIVAPEELEFDEHGIALWQGDITRLAVDAVVNAANSGLLGCFIPGHGCIDNAIHNAAGMQLRSDCLRIISAVGRERPGNARITRAYNLPARYVLHTVGPMVGRAVGEEERAALRSSYISCLNVAEERGLASVAFCCISTGVFNFPHEAAAEIATGAVFSWKLRHAESPLKVVFNTYLPADTEIYRSILGRM